METDKATAPIKAGKGTIKLSGTPEKLVGIINLHNESDSDARIKAFDVTETTLKRACFMPKRRLFVGRTLEAGSTCNVAIETSVDDLTPPGTYKLKALVGSQEQEIELEVKAHRIVEIHPDIVRLEGKPGDVITETIIVENNGNVPVSIGMLGIAVLTEVEQVCTSLQAALAETSKEISAAKNGDGGGYELFLNTLVNQLADKKVDLLRAKATTETEILPGEVESVPIEFHIPSNVNSGRSYRGKLLALDRSLSIHLMVTGSNKKTTQRKKRA